MELRLPDWPIIDFHLHFPVAEDDFLGGVRQRFIARFGRSKWDLPARSSDEYQEEWFLNWAFPRPEEASRPWEEQADLRMPEQELRLIFGGNAARLLKLDS